MNFAKFLRTPFLQNTSRRLLPNALRSLLGIWSKTKKFSKTFDVSIINADINIRNLRIVSHLNFGAILNASSETDFPENLDASFSPTSYFH